MIDVFDVVNLLDTDTEDALIKLASSNPVDGQIAAFLEAGAEAGLIVDAAVAGTPEQEANLSGDPPHPADLGLHRTSAPWAQARYGSTGRQGEGVRASVLDAAAEIAPMALAYGFGPWVTATST